MERVRANGIEGLQFRKDEWRKPCWEDNYRHKALSASILTLAGASLEEGRTHIHWPGRRTMRSVLLELGSGQAGRKC